MRVNRALAGAILLFGTAVRAEDPAAPTFTKDVAPVVFRNCTVCHRSGEVAPFNLITYADVKKRAKQIVRVTEKKIMPPWKAEPGFGDFHDARTLTPDEIAFFRRWQDAGTPEGEAKDLPPAPTFPDGWTLGEPDLVLEMPEAFTVPAEGRDVYRVYVLPMASKDDVNVVAAEFRPGNRKVVHHALFFLDTSGAARKLDEAEPGPGYTKAGGPGFIPSGGLGGWAPGAMPRRLPDGYVRTMKKGSDLVMQVHYHPSGKPETDRSKMGLYFAKGPPKKRVITIPLSSRQIDIPPGEKDYRISRSFPFPVDAEVVGVIPHAHLVCKEIKAEATLPDGTKQPLIWIKDWDFNWQDHYLYKTPLHLPKDTKVDVSFVYDNSEDNPRNPSTPPKQVKWGEQTTDEMAIVFVHFAVDPSLDLTGIGRFLRDRIRRGGGPGGAGGQGGADGSQPKPKEGNGSNEPKPGDDRKE